MTAKFPMSQPIDGKRNIVDKTEEFSDHSYLILHAPLGVFRTSAGVCILEDSPGGLRIESILHCAALPLLINTPGNDFNGMKTNDLGIKPAPKRLSATF